MNINSRLKKNGEPVGIPICCTFDVVQVTIVVMDVLNLDSMI